MFYKFSEKPSAAFLLAPFSTVPPSLKSENGPSCVLLLAEVGLALMVNSFLRYLCGPFSSSDTNGENIAESLVAEGLATRREGMRANK